MHSFPVSIIIITFNNEKQIKKCLDCVFSNIFNTHHLLKANLFIIDNDSTDRTIAVIEKNYSQINLIKNNKNIGFARAVNQGIASAQNKFDSKFFFILNPDAYLKNDCFEKMFHPAVYNKNEFKKELVSPLIINPEDNQPWFLGTKINWLRFKTQHITQEQTENNYALDYLPGCALLIPKTIIKKIGLFNENFFLYYEDADFSLRVKKAGFKLKIISQAICYHQESQSSTSKIKNYHLVKNGLIFFHEHYPKIFLPYFWFIFYLRLFYHKNISKKGTVIKALGDFKKIQTKIPSRNV